jgi:hypothetical protein
MKQSLNNEKKKERNHVDVWGRHSGRENYPVGDPEGRGRSGMFVAQ